MKDARPNRYMVDRRGTPDPDNSQYYVLDVVNDVAARSMLRRLVRSYRTLGASMRANELEELLDSTQADYVATVESRNPQTKRKKT